MTSSQAEIVSVDVFDMDIPSLQKEVLALRKRLIWIVALFRLVVVSMKVSGFSLDNARLPDGSRKTRLLRTIESSLSVLPLQVALRLLRLSQVLVTTSWTFVYENSSIIADFTLHTKPYSHWS